MAIKNSGKNLFIQKKYLEEIFSCALENIFKFFIIAEFICDSSQIYLSLMNIYDKQKREKRFFKRKKGEE